MQKITLYRRVRPDGGVSISPGKPAGEHTELYRLIADEGKTLTNGEQTTPCVDTDSPDLWTEIDDVDNPDALYAAAGKILMGVSE